MKEKPTFLNTRDRVNSAHLYRDNLLVSPCFIYSFLLRLSSMSPRPDMLSTEPWMKGLRVCLRGKELRVVLKRETARQIESRREREEARLESTRALTPIWGCVSAHREDIRQGLIGSNKISVALFTFPFVSIRACVHEREEWESERFSHMWWVSEWVE